MRKRETTKLGQRADSVADADLLPVEHVFSDFSEIILVRMPSAQDISAERTPRTPSVQESPQAPSTLKISFAAPACLVRIRSPFSNHQSGLQWRRDQAD